MCAAGISFVSQVVACNHKVTDPSTIRHLSLFSQTICFPFLPTFQVSTTSPAGQLHFLKK